MTETVARLQAVLAGRYQIERELGRGGMATVYLALDLRQERRVALKVLHPEVTAGLGPERFLREIKLTAQLRHPHILPLFDSGDAAGQLWYSMPYVEGETLRDRLRRDQRLPPEEALELAGDVLAALSYAHEHGIVHRDIKPENILLEGGEAVLADFGIAHAVSVAGSERLTVTGVAMGTITYMSPEQATAGTAIDGRSDLYSLGCVLYECIWGQPPFTGSPQAIIAQHLTSPPPMPPPGADPIPPLLVQALRRALAKSPEERYPTAAAMAAALESGKEIRQTPDRLHRRLALAAVTVLGLLVGTFYAGKWIATAPAVAGESIASGFNRKLTQITSGEGLEEWPAWSPDGTRLAFVAEVDGFRQLFVRNLPGGEERRLSRQLRDHIQPAWSRDGRRLAFVRAATSEGRLEPTDINGWYFEAGDIWMLNLETGEETRLARNAHNPALSPVTDHLAFDAGWAGARRIWISEADGRNPRQLASDSTESVVHTQPRWSPDGTAIAFRRIDNIKSDIVVIDLESEELTRLTDDNVLDMDPVWSPDRRHIYFSSSRGGGLNIWRVAVADAGRPSRQPEQLTTGAGDDIQPTVSPDGNRLAFAVRGINSDLWRLPVSPTTGQPRGSPELVVRTTRVESRGSWSPDGSTIAFNSDRLGEMNIWVRRLADSTDRQLTRGPGGDYQPDWSPDGRSLVFFSARAGNADIWSVAADNGRIRRLTSDPATDTNPFYSPDGSQIAFVSDRSGRSEIWVIAADGSRPRQLTSLGAGGHFLRWTEDGRSIVFRSETGSQIQVYRVSLDQRSLTRMPDVESGAHISFSPDHSLILDVKGHKSLWVYPVGGGTAAQVWAFPDPDIRIDYPTWSPDGKWILFDRAAPKGGDLWLLEGAK